MDFYTSNAMFGCPTAPNESDTDALGKITQDIEERTGIKAEMHISVCQNFRESTSEYIAVYPNGTTLSVEGGRAYVDGRDCMLSLAAQTVASRI
jgi:hypothetical protein